MCRATYFTIAKMVMCTLDSQFGLDLDWQCLCERDFGSSVYVGKVGAQRSIHKWLIVKVAEGTYFGYWHSTSFHIVYLLSREIMPYSCISIHNAPCLVAHYPLA